MTMLLLHKKRRASLHPTNEPSVKLCAERASLVLLHGVVPEFYCHEHEHILDRADSELEPAATRFMIFPKLAEVTMWTKSLADHHHRPNPCNSPHLRMLSSKADIMKPATITNPAARRTIIMS